MRLLLIIPLLLIGTAYAQSTGELIGRVVDAETRETIPGAHVVLEGTPYSTYSDLDGWFQIRQIPAASYKVSVSLIVFQSKIFDDVIVDEGNRTKLGVSLENDTRIGCECPTIPPPVQSIDPINVRIVAGRDQYTTDFCSCGGNTIDIRSLPVER